MPYTVEADHVEDAAEVRHSSPVLREVRHTVIRLVRDHLHMPADHPHSWQGHHFDFTDVTFDGGNFAGATFSGGTASFYDAKLSGGTVDLSSARGRPPSGIVPANGKPLPAGLILPPEWPTTQS
ncbi:hypothetical protein [Streptomyces sp. NPDC101165]|uniref:hypothetical protein n=1 Tax=Streptomyces sp. NPDC101165 TaxID=3366119 RepID=UPI003803156B